MELNEIKKLLYTFKPEAELIKVSKDGMVYWSAGDKLPEHKVFTFIVPLSEIGDATFDSIMPAQLLIRWLINPENEPEND
jgi:hypothetical protein